jgi:hypothetical protein
MAVEWCRGCGDLFGSDVDGGTYCSRDCKELAHRRLAPRRRDTPSPPTASVSRGFQTLADESSRYNAFHQRMRPV